MESKGKFEEIPKEIAHLFYNTNVEFKVSKFEEYMLTDIYAGDESTTIKLHRDVTQDLLDEIQLYIEEKRNLRFAGKGETRSGKSLSFLKICDLILRSKGEDFNEIVEKLVCGNQVEYRQKLKEAKFGDTYLVDENFFNNAGLGGNIEMSQLKDYNAIIAKKNISVFFINPEKFLNVGATLGLATYGRDSKNWLSRLLVYKFKEGYPYLIGYAIIDVGELFWRHGCFVFKEVGGCNNVNQKQAKDINPKLIKHSTCIPKDYDEKDLVTDNQTCPFYNICTHGLCKYEKKKDSWIEKEMEGTLDNRTSERYLVALYLVHEMFSGLSEDGQTIKLKARNGKDLKVKLRTKVPKYSNTKFGVAEFEELIQCVLSNCSIDTLIETLAMLDDEKILKKYIDLFGPDIKEKVDKQKQIIKEIANELDEK
jgi:hypothetical protein